jgi:hypothetical protein
LLFSDSFDYPAGELDGQGPPPGSPPGQGGWVKIYNDPVVGAFGLDFPAPRMEAKDNHLVHGRAGSLDAQ